MSSIKKNFFYNSILSVSRIIFPLISFPYSSRILGPDGIGRINFVDSYSQYFCLLAALGIPLYGVREVAKTRHDLIALKKLTSELLVLNFLGSLVCCVFYFYFFTGKVSGQYRHQQLRKCNGHRCTVMIPDWYQYQVGHNIQGGSSQHAT